MILALPLAFGCASPLRAADGGFRHAEHGFWVADPPPLAPSWQRAEVEGALLAYRRPGPTWMSLQVRCDVSLAEPRVLARHLRIGLSEHSVRESLATEHAGLPGWVQVFDVAGDGGVVRTKTVTLVGERCVFDWVLTARDAARFGEAQASFDAWWATLRLDAAGEDAAR